ncbi:MAG: hypothetical protein KGN02_10745 [bacterium]|nr:hypothetical protein [bacterium]
MTRFSRPLAVLALGALAACGGPTSSTAIPNTGGNGSVPQPATAGMLVGVGDSLTAGYQSSGFLGDPTVTNPNSGYPSGAVPPGQEAGWWADMYNQMTGVANSAAGVLPLIKGPGLASQIVIGTSAANLLYTTHSSCDAFNQQGFSSSAWTNTRMNPSAGVADLAVPGITMHEAVAMKGPITGPPTGANCGYTTLPNDPTSGGLQSLVAGESELFYPVLGGYLPGLGSNLTMLNAAVSLKPQLTTVWLGANDILKYSFSGGIPQPVSDTPQQMATDLTQIVTTLTKAGSKVLVADLPDVLSSAQFFPQTKLSADLQSLGIPSAAAGAIVSYVGTQYGVTAGGYLTETGFLSIVQGCNLAPATCVTPQLDPNGAGSGLGGAYLTPAFAGQVQALNDAYNQAIDGVAKSSGTSVALVPINQIFKGVAQTGYSVAGFPLPFTLHFGGGLVSWDGLHPSNTGYAVIANAFIQTADAPTASGGLGLSIPALTAAQISTIAQQDPYDSYAIKSVNPLFPFPLP